MVRVNRTGVTINGPRKDELKTQLESYYANQQHRAARKLLDLVAANTITLSDATDKPRIEGGKVLLFWHEQKADRIHHYNIKELGESALFELKNLLNKPRYTGVCAGKVFLNFGLAKAKLEAESTVTIVKILGELRTSGLLYKPSAWGLKQITEVGGKTGDAAQVHVANTTHDSSQRSNKFALKTKYLYTYEIVENPPKSISWIRGYLKRMLDIKSPTGKTYMGTWTKKKMRDAFSVTFASYGVSTVQIFIWLIYALRSIESTLQWKVEWKQSITTIEATTFADAVVNIIPSVNPNTHRVNEIKTVLMDAIENGV